NWNKIPKFSKYTKGFVHYEDMPKVYSSCKIVIDDANHVTKEWGSVNSRVFDSISSGKLVVTNGTKGNNEVFGGKIPEYHSEEELTDIINYYLINSDEREEKIKYLQDIVLGNHTYQHRANTLKEVLEEYYKKPKIIIKTPVPSWNEIHRWGDFYVAEGLKNEFEKKGYIVKIQMLSEWNDSSDSIGDTVIVLRGLSYYKPKVQHFNIMWNISHSDLVSLNEYELYDHVFIASKYWTEQLKDKVKVPVECMWQCTDINKFYPEYNEKYKSDLLFVGNSRKVYRKILKDLLPTEHNLSVYGADWGGLINKKYIKGDHIPNDELHQAYSSCKILLNDHWEDMREKGFISNRIFDGLACGAYIISDEVSGLDELFKGRVSTYSTVDELNTLIDDALNNPKKVSNDISGHTYEDRVNQFMDVIN
ncbi:glycosyltransferase family protein, partial [Methanosphaera sp.]